MTAFICATGGKKESFLIPAPQTLLLFGATFFGLRDLKTAAKLLRERKEPEEAEEVGRKHGAVDIPEPAREEMFYTGLVLFLLALRRTSNLPVRLLFTSGCCRRAAQQQLFNPFLGF